MKNVYLIQPNNILSNSVFLPYSVGAIAAYSFQHEIIKNEYNLCDFIFVKKNIDEVVSGINDPYSRLFVLYVEYRIQFSISKNN